MKLFIIIHILLSFIVAVIGIKKLNKDELISYLVFSLFFPIGGLISILILVFFMNHHSSELVEDEFIDPIILFTDKVDIESETNLISVEETLLLENTGLKRRNVINALKRDISGFIEKLNDALKDKDVETSHYAAAAITDARRKLDVSVQKLQVEHVKNPEDLSIMLAYREVLTNYIKSGLLDRINLRRMNDELINVLRAIIKHGKNDSEYYRQLIDLLLRTEQFGVLNSLCAEYLEKHESEDAFIAYLEYYFSIRDFENYKLLFNQLISSDITLSNKGMKIVRYWMEGLNES